MVDGARVEKSVNFLRVRRSTRFHRGLSSRAITILVVVVRSPTGREEGLSFRAEAKAFFSRLFSLVNGQASKPCCRT